MDERTDPATGRPLEADEVIARPAPDLHAHAPEGETIETVETTASTVGPTPVVGVPVNPTTTAGTPVTVRQTHETPEQLRGDVRKTRTELGATLGTIEERFTPSHVTGQMRDQAQSAIMERAQPAIDAATSAVDRVTPIAMQVRDQAQERFEQARDQVQRLQERDDVQQITSIVRERAPLILGGLAALGGALWLIGKLRGADDYEEWVEYLEDDDLEEVHHAHVDDTRMEMTLPAEVFISGNSRRKDRK